MLEANKSKLFEKIFAIYNRNLLKRRFNSLSVSGLDNFGKKEHNFPLLIYANHSSWWDGLVIFQILRKFDFESYVMMEEKQLKNLRLFRKLGAFSVIRENPREALKSVKYAVAILKKDSKNLVLIFPQGKIEPNDIRPIKFFNGISKILEKMENCNYLPIAIRYEFSNNFKPEIYVKIGEMECFQKYKISVINNFTNELELQMMELLDLLKSNIINKNISNYKNLL